MRKFFASAFGLSATLALVAGLVFAWTGTFSAPAGQPSFIGALNASVIFDSYTNTSLLPGVNTHTATGHVYNNTGVPITLTGGYVDGIHVPANPGCNGYVSGSVNITDPGPVNHVTHGGQWQSFLALHPDTHNACQTLGVDYTVNISITT